MKIETGMRCRFICAYGNIMIENGIVTRVSNDYFTVAEDSDCPPQYNDTYTNFREEDIGTKVFFDK